MKYEMFFPPCRFVRNIHILFLNLILLLASFGTNFSVLAAGSQLHLTGRFEPVHNWPIIPIATMLMPDGRVFAYGTTPSGIQDAKLNYAVWDPSLGYGDDAFQLLVNTTSTDIFCAAQAMIPTTGQALILGGDALVNTKRNYANSDVNIFDPATDTLIRQSQSMAFKRWYATAVTMPNGEHVVLGGRNDRFFEGTATIPATENTYSPIPEVRSVAGNWRTLTTASSEAAYGSLGGSAWYYPRAWVNPQGKIFILNNNGQMFQLDTSGTGTLTKYVKRTLPSRTYYPSVMFAPGKVLSVRNDRAAVTVDFNGTGEPVVSSAGSLVKDRQYGSATVLADGRVWINGGSSTGNTLEGASLDSELWDPKTGNWTTVASATKARLYHSSSLLLLDGSVLTAGGGAPGPATQLNGEIYYPPYFFRKDGSGELVPRPKIVHAPTTMIGWDQDFSIQATHNIARVTLVRVGASTHNFDNETRFFDLPVSEIGMIVTVRTPASSFILPPGFYMIFAWNPWGTPSVAKIIQIG
jgi:hypothetical protein